MSDLRDKQPNTREMDFTKDTFGNLKYEAKLHVWTYSSIKNEDVYSRNLIIRFRAVSMRAALGLAESIAATIEAAHDVWDTGVDGITVTS